MRLELSFTDYEKNDIGILTTYPDVLKIEHANFILIVWSRDKMRFSHKLTKLADLRLSVHEV